MRNKENEMLMTVDYITR